MFVRGGRGRVANRLEAQVAFTKLPQRFPGLRLAVPEHELSWRPGLLLRGLHTLPVRTGNSSG